MPLPFTFANVILFFAYGLAFVVMGLAIFFKCHKNSRLRLAEELKYLAAFGILHGFSEWMVLLIPLRLHFYPGTDLVNYILGLFVCKVLSFVCLLSFGALLFAKTNERFLWLKKAPGLLLGLWTAIFIMVVRPDPYNMEGWVLCSIWARYLLAFPAGIMAGRALIMQLPQFSAKDMPSSLKADLTASAHILYVYSFVAGLVVPQAEFFPASVINSTVFMEALHIPIEVVRSLCGLLLAIFIIRVLAFYDLEARRLVEEADRRQGVFEERERIGRDLHDGIIQSIYGVGLQLESCATDSTRHEVGNNTIPKSIRKLNEIIRDIRHYINDLRAPTANSDMREAIEQMVKDLAQQTEADVSLQMAEVLPDLEEEAVHNMLLILTEALYNAIKHAHADMITIIIDKRGEALYIGVIDDGIGFTEPEKESTHNGMRNMRKRALLIGAALEITGYPARGTELSLSIPCTFGGDR